MTRLLCVWPLKCCLSNVKNCVSKLIDINPYDYVSLINDANYVFTDSFHSTLFSNIH